MLLRARACALLLIATVASCGDAGVARTPQDIARSAHMQRGWRALGGDSSVRALWNDGTFTEGPTVAADGSVWFSDLPRTPRDSTVAGRVLRYMPGTGTAVVEIAPSGMANGLAFDQNGQLLVAQGANHGQRRVALLDTRRKHMQSLASTYHGHQFNSPNDLVVAATGDVYFTDPRYDGAEPRALPFMGLYWRDPSGTLALVDSGLGRPNGVALSPDERTLYVTSDLRHGVVSLTARQWALRGYTAVIAFERQPNGSLTNARVFADLHDVGTADGMVTDAMGRLYVALGGAQAILVFDDTGRRLGALALPRAPTNVAFGRGCAARHLYITAGTGLYVVSVDSAGATPRC